MSSDQSLVSVIVPAFNAAPFIGETLRSILAQTHAELEVLVVDDGSTDNTAAIVTDAAMRDKRVHLLRQPNVGVGAARNTAISRARGQYLAPIDADDLWHPEKIKRQVAAIENGGPEMGMVYCWFKRVDPRGLLEGYSHPHVLRGHVKTALIVGNFVGNASVPLFRSEAIRKVGGYLTRAEQGGAQGCEDWDLSLRVAEAFSVGVVPAHLVDYRQRPDSMSLRAIGMADSFKVVLRRAQARNPTMPDFFFQWSTGKFYRYISNKSFAWGHYGATLRYLARAIRHDPTMWLNQRTYRTFLVCILRMALGQRSRRPQTGIAPLSPPTSTRPSPPPWGERWFTKIHAARWAVAARDSVDGSETPRS